jgi:hypothetical protein
VFQSIPAIGEEAMQIADVINRALTDEQFATQLHQRALRAAEHGLQSEEFDALLGYFADSPEELARLRPAGSEQAEFPTWTTTITTTTTTTTADCTTTTTTTTTTTGSLLCVVEE